MDSEQVDLRSFVARCVSGEKQNDSVDSGVCPSPDEGYQNYDEAFPPLSTNLGDNESNVVVSSWQAAKRPADPSVYSFAPSPITFVDISSDRTTIGDPASPIHAGATPIKRPKLQVLNDVTNRPLRSCPDLPSQKSFQVSSGVTFCCPMVSASSSVKTAQASPQFVVPKCFKVGSWPLRSEKACKHANDVPFWSCSEWFCTVHKGIEFGLLSAKVGADAAKCLAPNTNNNIVSNCNNNSVSGTGNGNGGSQKDVVNSCCPSLSSSDVGGESMFDAPRFILHIINENENNIGENDFVTADNFRDDDEKPGNTQYGDNQEATVNADWTMTANAGLPEFTFTPYNNNLQPNISSSFPPQEIGFCLPKFDLPSAEQQCKIQSSCNTASPFSKLSEIQLQQQQQQQLSSNHSSFVNLNNAVGDAVQLNIQPQQQTASQTVAVPISPNTHFVPIRSESMEDAYYPKPGFDESFAALVDEGEYYVYRDCDIGRAATKMMNFNNSQQFDCCNESSERNNQLKTVNNKTNSASVRHSLPLKFKASLPVKMVQTENENNTNCLDDARSLEAEFEIWACKPISISGNFLSSIQ